MLSMYKLVGNYTLLLTLDWWTVAVGSTSEEGEGVQEEEEEGRKRRDEEDY